MHIRVCALYCVLCLHCGDLGHAVSACNVDVVNLSLSGLVTVRYMPIPACSLHLGRSCLESLVIHHCTLYYNLDGYRYQWVQDYSYCSSRL